MLDHIWNNIGRDPTKGKIDNYNQQVLKSLNDKKSEANTGEKGRLSDGEIEKLYMAVANHEVASLQFYEKYDPENRGIGFCFGRAMTAHLEALWTLKLHRSSIQKIWAVGNLNSGDTNWAYHVATTVRHKDGSWRVIDPIFGEPVSAEAWYKKMREDFDPEKSMVIFTTESKRFSPYADDPYQKSGLNDKFYNGFFVDLLESYKIRRKNGTL